MQENFNVSRKVSILAWLLIILGVVALITGFVFDPARAWTSILINNFYFLSLALGALFFIAIQYVTESGWSAMFKRVPGAMAFFIPVAFIIMLALFGGMQHIYEWAESGIAERDELIAHKLPYLNIPFFYIRVVVLFGLWIVLLFTMRRLSLREDNAEDDEGRIKWFNKNKHYSRIFIFVFALTFSVAAFDWIMSVDSHWFSALFGIRAIISSLYYAVAVIILIITGLSRYGYFENMNRYHMNDFARYMFRLSIVWGYLWFMQYLIIWYANIPETTFYYVYRVNEPYTGLFYINLIINWLIPFIVLMPDGFARKKQVLVPVSILLLAGFYISLFLQVVPGSTGIPAPGFIELGSFAGFAGGFMLVVMRSLSAAPLVPQNHPYLKESIEHHL